MAKSAAVGSVAVASVAIPIFSTILHSTALAAGLARDDFQLALRAGAVLLGGCTAGLALGVVAAILEKRPRRRFILALSALGVAANGILLYYFGPLVVGLYRG